MYNSREDGWIIIKGRVNPCIDIQVVSSNTDDEEQFLEYLTRINFEWQRVIFEDQRVTEEFNEFVSEWATYLPNENVYIASLKNTKIILRSPRHCSLDKIFLRHKMSRVKFHNHRG